MNDISLTSNHPFGWESRVGRLHLYWGTRTHPHKTSVLDMILNHLMGYSSGALLTWSTPSLLSLRTPLRPRVVVTVSILSMGCPVGWGCRMPRLFLCKGVRHPQRVSCIWYKTIWWWGSSNAGALGNVDYPFIAIVPRSTLTRNGSTW